MAIEANIVYLKEEIKNFQERIDSIVDFLNQNPLVSIYCRAINGKIYYYKKFRKNGESVSEFFGNEKFDIRNERKKIDAENRKIRKAKFKLMAFKRGKEAMEKQLKIAQKAFKSV
jgi:hypothetical protein